MGKEKKLVGWFMIAAAALLVFFMLSRREGFDSSGFSSDSASSAKEAAVILFYIDNCPHCDQLKPVWANLKKKFGSSIAAINCTPPVDPETQAIMKQYLTPPNMFPTIVNVSTNDTFQNSDRSEANLTQFINDAMTTKGPDPGKYTPAN